MNNFLERLFIIGLLFIVPAIAVSQEGGEYLLKVKSLLDRGLYGSVIDVAESGGVDDYRVMLMCGEAALRSGDHSLAISYYEKAERLNEGSGQLGLAKVYAAKDDAATSVHHLEQHLLSSFRKPERELLVDTDLKRIDESKIWIRLWQREWYTLLEKGVEEVEYLVSKGRLSNAIETASAFSGLYSDDPATYYVSGLLAYSGGQYREASSFLLKSLDRENANSKVWLLYINSLGMTGDYSGVIRASEEAVKLFPENLSFRVSLTEGLKMTGEADRSFRISTEMLQYYPDNSDLLRMAATVAGSSGNYTEALHYLSRNIENRPGEAGAFTLRGDLYLTAGSYEFAISDYSMALDLDPLNGDVWYNKAMALIYEQRIDEVCHDLKMARRYGNKKASAMINRYCIGK